MGDALFMLRNYYYVGDYVSAGNEGSTLQVADESVQLNRDVFVYRSQLAQGNYQLVINSIFDDAPAPLLAVKLLASYFASSDSERPAVVEKVEKLFPLPICQIVRATILSLEGLFSDAIGALHGCSELEAMSLRALLLLKLERLDLAQKELDSMQKVDPDATLTQLTEAWVNIRQGGEKVQSAHNILQELSQRFGETVRLLNGMAACQLALGHWAEAEGLLMNSLKKNANDPDTLVNLICCLQHNAKPVEQVNQYLTQLKSCASTYALTRKIDDLDKAFDRLADQYTMA
eukprot:TRINITY_DN4554_c0_g1::TRINITY_DN4554_c0_g1_i1::g.23298::m.23298 TRINITY_DN4554_c0_g1::TRINITY_DN4554_c0_g1_i1::g.23298  ORF type:complete len:316 (-),score=70.38,sp/Q5ZIK9/COPE_CHICK/40.34/5e-64,Coatomer_E/PF04733.9/1.8e-78,TPR_19/PF14559.1/7.8e+03,TPR_19/PF14559.1/0.16,TPR_19/PF14559.1/5.9e-05,TPR_16/PF13432.1/5.4e+03,TPR_16/PF13432.1/2.1,TPR_16/PF13432.1/0.15,TPR_14/PF13428.1/3.5e+03,TPR_14/PF13428.1/6.6e+03,TPR_14/PF13428.1/18,TPR_14/PF13428.1/1.1e+03,TPR_14/PF13428.1/0.065,TPR_11/PF13414.1/1